MLKTDITRTGSDLEQILALQEQNLKQHLTEAEKLQEGFLTMQFTTGMLKRLHDLAPSVIVRDGDKVIAYAIVLLQEGRKYYPDLETMFVNLETVSWQGKSLQYYNYYVMGQICIDKNYRGRNVFQMLYDKHCEINKGKFDFIVTEISTSNLRSIRAHEKTGFRTIHTYKDYLDEWNVVLWDWK